MLFCMLFPTTLDSSRTHTTKISFNIFLQCISQNADCIELLQLYFLESAPWTDPSGLCYHSFKELSRLNQEVKLYRQINCTI